MPWAEPVLSLLSAQWAQHHSEGLVNSSQRSWEDVSAPSFQRTCQHHLCTNCLWDRARKPNKTFRKSWIKWTTVIVMNRGLVVTEMGGGISITLEQLDWWKGEVCSRNAYPGFKLFTSNLLCKFVISLKAHADNTCYIPLSTVCDSDTTPRIHYSVNENRKKIMTYDFIWRRYIQSLSMQCKTKSFIPGHTVAIHTTIQTNIWKTKKRSALNPFHHKEKHFQFFFFF